MYLLGGDKENNKNLEDLSLCILILLQILFLIHRDALNKYNSRNPPLT